MAPAGSYHLLPPPSHTSSPSLIAANRLATDMSRSTAVLNSILLSPWSKHNEIWRSAGIAILPSPPPPPPRLTVERAALTNGKKRRGGTSAGRHRERNASRELCACGDIALQPFCQSGLCCALLLGTPIEEAPCVFSTYLFASPRAIEQNPISSCRFSSNFRSGN